MYNIPSVGHCFFLASELKLLSHNKVFADGIFKSICNLKLNGRKLFGQVYIISIQYNFTRDNRDETMSYPVIICPTFNRQEITYKKLFSYIKDFYSNLYQEELVIPKIAIDFEKSTINAIENEFPDSKVLLCGVHMLRNFSKRIKKLFGNFYSDSGLREVFEVLKAAPFIPFSTEPALIITLKTWLEGKKYDVHPSNQTKYTKDFLKDYLYKFYLNKNSKYGYLNWNFFDEAVNYQNSDATTNVSESLNNIFNRNVYSSYQTREKLFDSIVQYKKDRLNAKTSIITLGTRKNRRSILQQKILDNRLDLCNEFSLLSTDEKRESLIHYCKNISKISFTNLKGESRTFESDVSDPEEFEE